MLIHDWLDTRAFSPISPLHYTSYFTCPRILADSLPPVFGRIIGSSSPFSTDEEVMLSPGWASLQGCEFKNSESHQEWPSRIHFSRDLLHRESIVSTKRLSSFQDARNRFHSKKAVHERSIPMFFKHQPFDFLSYLTYTFYNSTKKNHILEYIEFLFVSLWVY
jgi:hypothetical protein